MDIRQLDPVTLIQALAAFGLVLTLWSAVVVVLARRRGAREEALRRRLEPDAEGTAGSRTLRLFHEGEESTTVVRGSAVQLSLSERLEQWRVDAGFDLPARTLLSVAALALVAVAAGAGAATGRVVPAIVAPTVLAAVLWWIANRRVLARRSLFERQLVDGLELCARALRAGHPLLSAFRLMSEEIPPPVGNIFADIVQQQAMGVRMEDALKRAATLNASPDMKIFAASLAINLRTGGHLADVMDGIAEVVRERMRLSRRFRVLIAQTEMSKRILIGMPFILFGVLNAISPEYMDVLYDTRPGQIALVGSCISLMLGWVVMNKMADIKV